MEIKYVSKDGLSYFYSKIKALLGDKADKSKVNDIETAANYRDKIINLRQGN